MHVYFVPHPPLAVPSIGGGNERRIQATLDGFERIGQSIKEVMPDTIVFITPHGNAFREALAFLDSDRVPGDFAMFGHEDVAFTKEVNRELTESIIEGLTKAGIPAVKLNADTAPSYGVHISLDHGVMVPMHYIDKYYDDYKIVHITSSFASAEIHRQAGQVIRGICDDFAVRTLLVASGDLSHALKEEGPYSYNPFGQVFDKMVAKAIKDKNPRELLQLDESKVEEAAQCGLRSYCMAFGYAGEGYKSEVFSYEGPFGVGYLTGELSSN